MFQRPVRETFELRRMSVDYPEVLGESVEVVEEGIFKRKKKEKPDKQQLAKKEYPVTQIKSEITKIKAEVNRLFRTEEKLKGVKGNGLEPVSDDDTYDYTEPRENSEGKEVFLSGDEFWITRMDLWDYKGGNPRVILQDDGKHPIYDADNLVRKLISEFLEEKYPHFRVVEYGGDWDTSSMNVVLK